MSIAVARKNKKFVEKHSAQELLYAAYLRSARWRRYVRPIRLWLDSGVCGYCGTHFKLQVHHLPQGYKWRGKDPDDSLFYYQFGNALDIILRPWSIIQEIRYSRTLCDTHHKEAHGIK
jgi:hypothetical protein